MTVSDDIRRRAEHTVARDEARAARPKATGPKPLTEPQQRMLAKVRAQGTATFNGRARRTVEALEAAGLVNVEYDLVPHVGRWTERFIVRALEPREGLDRCACGSKYWDGNVCHSCGETYDPRSTDQWA